MEDNLTLESQQPYPYSLINKLEKYYDSKETIDSERYVGIEIEVEKAAPSKVGETINESFIRVTLDHSLRNDGLEYITCPHKSKHTVNLLKEFFPLLKKGHEFTQRTSIHIHVNARDMTPKQIRALVLVYLTVERLLYNWIGHDRDKSIFCVPIIETELASMLLNKKQFNWMKYTGLNLKPLGTLGTIEFRHLYGTSDIDKTIEPWLNIILALFRYAKEVEYSYIIKRIFELNTTSNYYAFLHDVFGEYAGLLANKTYYKDMEEGVCYIKTHSLTNMFAKTCAKIHPGSPLAMNLERKQKQKIPVSYQIDQETILPPTPGAIYWATSQAVGSNTIMNHQEALNAINQLSQITFN